jgi:hypothetical protein
MDMMRVARYWVPVAAYMGLIFYLSAQSHPEEQLPSFLAELWYRAFRWGAAGFSARQAMLFAVVAASLYGLSDEVHQLFVPFRESSWQDWAADTAGAGLGAFMMHRVYQALEQLSASAVLD